MTMIELTPEQEAEIERRFMEFDPTTATIYTDGDDLPPHLALIRAQATADYYRDLADQTMRDAVAEARAAHLSWHKIGVQLGVTGEAVRQRFAAV